jgi:hypothetical protein
MIKKKDGLKDLLPYLHSHAIKAEYPHCIGGNNKCGMGTVSWHSHALGTASVYWLRHLQHRTEVENET